MVIFLVGSALCGLSGDMSQLILFRGIQGVGAGAIVPVSLAIIGDLFPPADRARLQAAFSSLFVVAFLLGPTLGGVLADTVGWRWVFYLNLPVGLVALSIMWRFMPLLRGQTERRAFDLLGVVLFVAAVVPFLVGVRNLPGGSLTDPEIGGLMLLGLAIAALFVVVEARAAEPIVPVRLFRDPTFAVASAVVFLSVAGLFVSIMFMPRYFQFVHGASATSSGWQIMTLLAGLLVGAIGCGQVVARTGRWKALLLGSMAIGTAGMLLLTGLHAELADAARLGRYVPHRAGPGSDLLGADGRRADDGAGRCHGRRDEHDHVRPAARRVHLAGDLRLDLLDRLRRHAPGTPDGERRARAAGGQPDERIGGRGVGGDGRRG